MKEQSLKKQTALTAGIAAAVRAIGFGMRLWVSRQLGAEAVGVMELTGTVHMLALTPFAAGLPGAVSRMTARAAEPEKEQVLSAGRQLALGMAAVLTPLFLMLAPRMAHWLGDGRTLPGLYCFSPCMALIGVSCVYNGYFYGRGNAWPPMLGELMEQLMRLLATVLLLGLLPWLTVAWRAAMPAVATVLGEGAGLALIVWMGRHTPGKFSGAYLSPLRKKLWRQSCPLMLSRFSHTGLRMLCGMIIPQRLMAAGLSQSEAVSRLGMLNGMVMPLMFLPGMLAGALATVGGPAAAKCASRRAESRLMLRLVLPAGAAGMLCAGGLYLFAPWISQRLYRLPELASLLRLTCPMAVILPVQQVLGGVMTGLGLQKKSLIASLLGALLTLALTWQWTGNAGLHILGAGRANMMGHALTLFCALIYLLMRKNTHQKSA